MHSFNDEVKALRNLAMGDGAILGRIDRIVVAYCECIEEWRRSYDELQEEYRQLEAEHSELGLEAVKLTDEVANLKRSNTYRYVSVWKDGFDEGFSARGSLEGAK